MTTKTLVRTSPLDFDRARGALRDRAGIAAPVGEHQVRVTVEPLLRHGADGVLERSIRVDSPVPITTAEIRDLSGGALTRGVRTTADGLRVFLVEPEEEVDVDLTLPELGASAIRLTVAPARRWNIHLVHHSHLDIGYTDPQGRVIAEHLSYLDSALRLVKQTSDWQADAQFRWTVESLWSFTEWARSRPDTVVAEFVEQVREGRIELTAMPFNLHTETCSTDELHELLRFAVDTRHLHGVPITTAMQTDVPGSVAGLVDVLSANQVNYLSVAHNWAGRSVPHLTGGQDVPRLFWWQSASGRRVLTWVTDTPHGLAYMEGPMLGFDVSYEDVDTLLPAYLVALAAKPYPFDGTMFGFASADVEMHRQPYDLDILHLRIQGHFGDNAPPRMIMSETVRRWNEEWAYPRLRMSTNADFFEEAERRYGDQIPTFVGDWNDWWADGVGAGARPMQMVREAQSALADAQTLSCIASTLGAGHAQQEARDTRAVYLETSLFNEHTWGAADPWTHGHEHQGSGHEQWHWKYARAIAARDGARALLERSKSRLARVLPSGDDAVASVYALNSTERDRSGVLRVFLPESVVPTTQPLAAVDARTSKVLAEVDAPQVNPTHREAGRFLQIAVDDVPALGWVRIDLMPATATQPEETVVNHGDPVLENEYLRVEVDLPNAAIKSIVVKSLGRDLVRPDATFGFNSYIYDEFGSATGFNHQSGHLEADDRLSLFGRRSLAGPAAVVEVGQNAVRRWFVYETRAAGVERIRTTLSLEHGSDRLDISNEVSKEPTMVKESAYFAFPFAAAQDAVLRYDITGSVTGNDIESVPGGAVHMRAMRRWVSLQGDGVGISWTTQDAPLLQLGDIAMPYAPFPATTPESEPTTLYSWVHNNLWDTNFPVEQGFAMAFRYSISAAVAATPEEACAQAAAVAADRTQPFVGVVAATAGPSAVQAEGSLLRVSDPRVRVVGITAPTPRTLLVRLASVAEAELEVTLHTNLNLVAAQAATYLGETRGNLPHSDRAVSLVVEAMSTTACLLHVDSDAAYIDPLTQRGDNHG